VAIQGLTVARHVAQRFAEAIRDEPAVKHLWAWGEPSRLEPGHEAVDLWVFLDSADDESEKRIIAAVPWLQRQFPEVDLFLHLIHGQMPSDFDPMTEVHPEAEKISLTRA
jgi:hypothetical protein